MTPSVETWAQELAGESPYVVMKRTLEAFGDGVAIAFSGGEDVLLLEYAHQSGLPFRVFALDTGRLPPETYQAFAAAEAHYGIRIEYCFPDAARVESLVRNKGLFSFLEDGHEECCGIRKVEPLARYLTGLRAWITGQRRDQSPTRASVARVELDAAHAGPEGPLVKLNPLAETTAEEVWDAIRAFGVPYNPLFERGYRSLGCAPCTRAVLPGEHERAGRWWWEEATRRECGLHR